MINGGIVTVMKCISSLRVFNKGVALFVNGVEAEECSIYLVAAVSRGVINDYCMVVCVILGKYRIEIVLYAKFGVIIVARHHYTHIKFFLKQ